MSTVGTADFTTVQTNHTVDYTLANLATVIAYRDVLSRFQDHAPSKLKWSNLDRSHLARFTQQNILTQEPTRHTGKSTQNIWTLERWVTNLLSTIDELDHHFSDDEISFLAKRETKLTGLPEKFTLANTEINSRTIGKLNEYNLVELVQDNKHTHESSVWKLTDRLQALLRIYDT